MSEPIGVEGLRQTNRALKKMGDELAQGLKPAALAAAQLVADTGHMLAPRADGILAGTVRAGASMKGATVKAGGRRAPGGPLIHFGAVRDKRTGRRRNIPANPFLYDALDRRRTDVVARFEDGLMELAARTEQEAST